MSNWKLPRGSFCSSLLFSTHHRVDSGADKAISIESAQGRLHWNISGISPPWNIPKLQRTQGISSVRGGRGWLVPNVFHATQKFQLWIWPRPTWVSKIASAFPAFPPPGHPTRMSYYGNIECNIFCHFDTAKIDPRVDPTPEDLSSSWSLSVLSQLSLFPLLISETREKAAKAGCSRVW